MSERDWTRQSGKLSSRFAKAGLFWLSFADSGLRTRNKIGCDGILCNPVDHTFAFVEVKIGNRILTDNEIKFAEAINKHGFSLYVLRIFPNHYRVAIISFSVVFHDYWTDKIESILNVK